MGRRSPSHARGIWVVLAMIAAGILAGGTAFYYWTNHVTVADDRPGAADRP